MCSTSFLSPVRLFLVLISFTGMSLCMLSPTVQTQCHQRCVGHERLSHTAPSSSTPFAVYVVCPSHAPISFVPSGVVVASHHQRTTQQASRCLSPICSPTVPLSFKSCVPLSLTVLISAWQPLRCWRCSPIKPTTISSRVIPQRPLFVKAPHAPISFSVLWWRFALVPMLCFVTLFTFARHTTVAHEVSCLPQVLCTVCLLPCCTVHRLFVSVFECALVQCFVHNTRTSHHLRHQCCVPCSVRVLLHNCGLLFVVCTRPVLPCRWWFANSHARSCGCSVCLFGVPL